MSEQIYILYAICHVLKEFGYHKETCLYFVKPKNEPPVILPLEKRNCWNLKHYDFNKREKYVKRMGDTWEYHGSIHYNIFSKFDKDGYICSLPKEYQLIEFSERNGFSITNITDLKLTLKELIIAYRKLKKRNNAFEKYLKLCE